MLALLTTLALALLPAPKTIAHVDLLDAQTAIVVYSDCSAAIASLEAFNPNGSVRPGYPLTIIEAPAGTDNVTKWKDVNGLDHEVRTGCATLTAVDCAILHAKYVDAMLKLYPVPKVRE